MTTITVRLEDAGQSQSELQAQLGRLVGCLESKGMASGASIEPVFPGDEKGRWKTTFVVRFSGKAGSAVAENLKKMPGVELAYVAPSRG